MDRDFDERVRELESRCVARGWTLGLAESCTGGLIAASICRRPGVSAFFLGAVVSYARSVKAGLLDVPMATMQTHGEVSVEVARAMAAGARRRLGCDWSVSVTGIAGPGGGAPDKPVGTVCFAVVGPGFEDSVSKRFPADGGRQDIQRQAALFAFDFLINAMR